MLLPLSRKEVVKLQSRLCDFVLKFQVSRRACYRFFLGRPNFPLEFCKSMQRLWSTSKKTIFSQLPIDILSGRTCFEGIWGCPLNLPPHCRLFLNRVFQRWRLKTTGQVSSDQFSYTKKLLMKLEVNQCYHAFQEDFAI